MTYLDTMLVRTSDSAAMRGSNPKEEKVEVLVDNFDLFLTQNQLNISRLTKLNTK